ncbi:metallophosphoesterase family protein [Agrobacterium sp. rho-13.3]|uniref:metallophosphoesterase family protein n=1 Tax=Agrobacterium sp. rho-13.3 TaxID=3072980 RepID=UPI002A173EE4|nr:metallophosphoesterase [Agrobacterium sp. rho-13.3]MDX8306175.1 metallophosphoesterase [Agrobacterium sp. rho-13.3]MDX8307494.1 metallophosphoesterase [Agrobacterium sp. rho-13.3]
MQIAVVADVHLHDLYGGYGTLDQASGEVALRTLADTMASTRVFNESHAAFLAVLDDIVRRGIRDVVLLGDYSDDGQFGAVAAVKKVLSFYEHTHGLRFFVTFGNHDCYGLEPRHQAKWLTKADGLNPLLVTSDDRAQSPAIVRPEMLGMSSADAMEAMANYGVRRPVGVYHWETPFGDQDGLEHHSQSGDPVCPDASYLVEPQNGLWLLMLDANVFYELDGVWQVRSNAAWDHVLAQRPYILKWIADVAERARLLGKTLLAFSHYPVLPLALSGKGEDLRSVCTPDWQERMPSLKSGRLLEEAGIRWHFSGHMHVAGRTELNGLINLAVPSPVAYPGGYVIAAVEEDKVSVETVALKETPGFDVAFSAYKQQVGEPDKVDRHFLIASPTYSDFLRTHLLHLVGKRHIPDDWPPDMLDHLDRPIEHLFRNDRRLSSVMEKWQSVVLQPFRLMMEDYYFLRAGDRSTMRHMHLSRDGFYRDLREALRPFQQVADCSVSHAFLVLFFAYLDMP